MNNIAVIEVDKQGLRDAKKQVNGLTVEAKNLRNEVKKLQGTKVVTEVFLNVDKFEKSLNRTEKLLKQLTVSKFEVLVSTDDTLVHRLCSTIKGLTGKKQVVHLDIDTGSVFAELNLLKRQLNALTSRKWNVAISNPGLNKRNIPLGYAAGIPNTVQASGKNRETYSDAIAPIADLLTFYTAADLLIGKMFKNPQGGTTKISPMNKLLTKASSAITASGKINLAAGSTGLKVLSAGTVAGGVLTGVGIIDSGYHIFKGMNSSNEYDTNYETAKGGITLGGTLLGATIGSIFGIPGALIGGGIGYIASKVASSPIANAFTGGKVGAMKDATVSPNAAKRLEELRAKQDELAKSKLDKKFGAVKLSAEQVAKATEDLFNPLQTTRIYNAEVAALQLNDAFGVLQQSSDGLRKDIWIASTKGQLSSQKITGLKASVNTFETDAQTALKEKQYAANESVRAIMGDSKEGEGVLNSMDQKFQEQQEKFDKVETKLNRVTDQALADGKVTRKEQRKIDGAMSELMSLTKGEDSEAEFKAGLEKLDLDIKGDIDRESFQQIMAVAMESAGQRVNSLENSYINAAGYLNDDQKKVVLWGENGQGDKAGLYHQELETYLDLAGVSIDEVLGRLSGELGFLTKDLGNGKDLSENIFSGELLEYITKQSLNEHGGLSKEAGKQLNNMDAGTKAALGNLADGLSPVVEELMKTAKIYEEQTGKVPEGIQNFLRFVDMLHHISDNEGAKWFFDNGGKNKKKKFKLDNYTYMILTSSKEALQTKSEQIQEGDVAYSSGLPQVPQVSFDGKPVIEGQSSITAKDFGIPSSISTTVDVYIQENRIFGKPSKGAKKEKRLMASAAGTFVNIAQGALEHLNAFRGGIVDGSHPGFAEGGYVRGGAQLITVAEEGTPEAIIPLGKHRRERAMELFNQVGSYLQAPGFAPKGFAAGGIVGGSIRSGVGGGATVVEVGGVEIRVEGKDGQNLVETIRDHKEEISEEIAGVFHAAFKGQFANTPVSGGVSA